MRACRGRLPMLPECDQIRGAPSPVRGPQSERGKKVVPDWERFRLVVDGAEPNWGYPRKEKLRSSSAPEIVGHRLLFIHGREEAQVVEYLIFPGCQH